MLNMQVAQLIPYLRHIDANRWYTNHGPLVGTFERRLADLLSLPAVALVSAASGTAALIGAILAVAGRASPERPYAVLPGFTFVATAASVEQCGYRIHLADVDPDTWMLDRDSVIDICRRKKVGLIVVVAPFGRPVAQRPWQSLQRETGIPVVIDGAASFEGVAGRPEEFLGGIPVAFSFHATKSFATGEGGAIATFNERLAKAARTALNFGFYGSRDSVSPSTNGKMSEYHAAIGLAELDGWHTKRRDFLRVAERYRLRFGEQNLRQRLVLAPEIAGCYAMFRCAGTEQAAAVQQALQRHAIGFRFWYGGGLHDHGYLRDVSREPLPVTEDIAARLVGIPMAPDLNDNEIERIAIALAALPNQPAATS
jgi:dTDP-4-amino-4,6-dideoxygalactose transaminase